MVRWVEPPGVWVPDFGSETTRPERLPELPRNVEELPAPRTTGTSPELPLDPPARCLKSAPVWRPALVREREALLLPSRIRKPALPLMRTPSSKRGRSRDVTLTPALLLALTPVADRLFDLYWPPSTPDILTRLVMASRCRESGVSALTIRETAPYSRVLVTGPPWSLLVKGW